MHNQGRWCRAGGAEGDCASTGARLLMSAGLLSGTGEKENVVCCSAGDG